MPRVYATPPRHLVYRARKPSHRRWGARYVGASAIRNRSTEDINSVKGTHQMKSADLTTAVNTYSFQRRGLASLLLGTALALSCTTDADAATFVYLKWSDTSIVGDSTNAHHLGEVALTSYSQNASNPVNLTKKGDTALCGQITIMKQIDQSSPAFLGKVLTGSVSSATVPVTITFEKSAAVAFQFYKVELYQVAVTSITQSDSQADTVNETIMLEAGKFRYTFTPQNIDGTIGVPVTFGWDCLANRQL
jgi:type VI protein secretion system component Hcp